MNKFKIEYLIPKVKIEYLTPKVANFATTARDGKTYNQPLTISYQRSLIFVV